MVDDRRPVIFLDVDGVLNAVCAEPDTDVWLDYQKIRVPVEGRTFPICYSPSVIRMMADWHEHEAEVRWLTTWEDWALGLADAIGLPAFTVAGRRHEVEVDVLGWWKLAVVQRFVAAEPGRPFVWIDDDLYFDRPARRWLDDLATPFLAITPQTSRGLTHDDLMAIDAWLAQWSAEVAS